MCNVWKTFKVTVLDRETSRKSYSSDVFGLKSCSSQSCSDCQHRSVDSNNQPWVDKVLPSRHRQRAVEHQSYQLTQLKPPASSQTWAGCHFYMLDVTNVFVFEDRAAPNSTRRDDLCYGGIENTVSQNLGLRFQFLLSWKVDNIKSSYFITVIVANNYG